MEQLELINFNKEVMCEYAKTMKFRRVISCDIIFVFFGSTIYPIILQISINWLVSIFAIWKSNGSISYVDLDIFVPFVDGDIRLQKLHFGPTLQELLEPTIEEYFLTKDLDLNLFHEAIVQTFGSGIVRNGQYALLPTSVRLTQLSKTLQTKYPM